ncbi:hypothetical protein AS850_05940 [Frondihabitans sp. 762G35]|nr:hypothetical protein AS850_05940 [Frondihabitans sp. 762G35]
MSLSGTSIELTVDALKLFPLEATKTRLTSANSSSVRAARQASRSVSWGGVRLSDVVAAVGGDGSQAVRIAVAPEARPSAQILLSAKQSSAADTLVAVMREGGDLDGRPGTALHLVTGGRSIALPVDAMVTIEVLA